MGGLIGLFPFWRISESQWLVMQMGNQAGCIGVLGRKEETWVGQGILQHEESKALCSLRKKSNDESKKT